MGGEGMVVSVTVIWWGVQGSTATPASSREAPPPGADASSAAITMAIMGGLGAKARKALATVSFMAALRCSSYVCSPDLIFCRPPALWFLRQLIYYREDFNASQCLVTGA